jgi:hypothetical protein
MDRKYRRDSSDMPALPQSRSLFDDDAPGGGFLQAATKMGGIPQRDRNAWRLCCEQLKKQLTEA